MLLAEAPIVLKSLGGTTHTFPRNNQLLFIGSTKKSHAQIQDWFSSLQKHPEVVKEYQVVAVPVIRGFFSASILRTGFVALLNRKVPEKHYSKVVPVYEDEEGFSFFSALQKNEKDELVVVLIDSAGKPLWETRGAFTEAKLMSLVQAQEQRFGKQAGSSVAAVE